MKVIKINNPKEFVTVLTEEQLQIIAHSLALHVEEVTIKDTKQEIIEILHVLAKNNIWGHANFWKEEIED
tara:strand:- start:27 stop:236 length:210 start_codon:yes stop_codon:yes gene_type:complete